jgi:hypothetical protein
VEGQTRASALTDQVYRGTVPEEGVESEIEDQAGYQPYHMNKNGVSYVDICIYAYVWCMLDAVII